MSCRRLAILFMAIVLVTLSLSACAKPSEENGAGESIAKESIKIGVPLPLTGTQANFGEILQKAYRMAADEINAAGGVNGRKLELVIKDHEGKPEAAMALAESMIAIDKVPLLVGGYASATAYSIAQVAQKNKVPYLVDVASADRVTQQGWDYVFRFSETSSMAMDGPISFMEEVAKPKSLALAYENSVFGNDTIVIVEEWAEENNVEIVYSDSFMPGSVDFKPLLSNMKQTNPDIIIAAAYLTDAVLIARQSKELDINASMLIGAGAGFVLPEFVTQVGDASEYIASASIWQPDMTYPGVDAFVQDWVEKNGSAPTYHAASGYSSIYIIKDALERAASLSPEDIAKAFQNTDLMTIYGPIKFEDFDGYINQSKPTGVMVQWIDGKLPTVWPAAAASADYVYPVPRWGDR